DALRNGGPAGIVPGNRAFADPSVTGKTGVNQSILARHAIPAGEKLRIGQRIGTGDSGKVDTVNVRPAPSGRERDGKSPAQVSGPGSGRLQEAQLSRFKIRLDAIVPEAIKTEQAQRPGAGACGKLVEVHGQDIAAGHQSEIAQIQLRSGIPL